MNILKSGIEYNEVITLLGFYPQNMKTVIQ